MKYNFLREEETSEIVTPTDKSEKQISDQSRVTLVINKIEGKEPYDLETFKFAEHKEARFRLIFQRYKKLFLVQIKSPKPIKNFTNNNYNELFKYI